MVLKCESYPGAGYQQQTYMVVRETDGYSQNGYYNGSSGIPTGYAQSHDNYPKSHMPVFQRGHSEQKPHSGWGHTEQKPHSGWGHTEQKDHSGYYNSAPGTVFSGEIPHSEGYANHYQGSKYGHMGAGNGHSNYSRGGSDMHGYGGNKKSWTLKGIEDQE